MDISVPALIMLYHIYIKAIWKRDSSNNGPTSHASSVCRLYRIRQGLRQVMNWLRENEKRVSGIDHFFYWLHGNIKYWLKLYYYSDKFFLQ